SGVLLNRDGEGHQFEPLPVYLVPAHTGEWQSQIQALPDYMASPSVPAPVDIDIANNAVSLFLPSFDKKQVQLTQYGPEVTIEAGDQRRNLVLPKSLQGLSVTGAKFQADYLILSFG
ncbi:MAG: ArsA family ATPase, partial [Leptolyngbya sp. SIO3F4]|nr:ArsA family ATPase [Leptolyngbya sp. SIO3F4]